MGREAELFLKMDCQIGETPIWDAAAGKFYFIDILSSRIHVYEQATGDVATIDTGQHIGCIALREKGGLIAGLVDGIYYVDTMTGKLDFITNPEKDIENNRFNDGKCDPAGRFWVGSMSRTLDSGAGDSTPRGALYCMYADGHMEKKVDRVAISNGLAWNSRQDTMYYIDSPTKKVVAFDYDVHTADITNRRTVFDFAGYDGIPDGMCIDTNDNLWIAFFGGGVIRYCDPEKGAVLDEVAVPATKVACAVFGGDCYDELYITTGAIETDMEKYPDAGSVFRVRPDVGGTAPWKFKG